MGYTVVHEMYVVMEILIRGYFFYRPHRAYLINFNFIVKYDASAIYLKKGQVLMAKQNYQDFVKCYLRFNQRKGKE